MRVGRWALAAYMLAVAGAGAQAGERAPLECAETALELVLFTKPGCATCESIAKVTRSVQAEVPRLRVMIYPNEGEADLECARFVQSTGRPAEGWGPSVAILLGSGWTEAEGKTVLKRLHGELWDRAGVHAEEWKPGQARRRSPLGEWVRAHGLTLVVAAMLCWVVVVGRRASRS
jgi:hypothetical protein